MSESVRGRDVVPKQNRVSKRRREKKEASKEV